MTYGEWIELKTIEACNRETISKKIQKGRSPEWIHEEDGYSMDLILDVQAKNSGKNEIYESLMEGLMEALHDIKKHGEPHGWKTVLECADEEPTSLYDKITKMETLKSELIASVCAGYAIERIATKLTRGCSPEWIREEDEYPLDLILEVKDRLETNGEFSGEVECERERLTRIIHEIESEQAVLVEHDLLEEDLGETDEDFLDAVTTKAYE